MAHKALSVKRNICHDITLDQVLIANQVVIIIMCIIAVPKIVNFYFTFLNRENFVCLLCRMKLLDSFDHTIFIQHN